MSCLGSNHKGHWLSATWRLQVNTLSVIRHPAVPFIVVVRKVDNIYFLKSDCKQQFCDDWHSKPSCTFTLVYVEVVFSRKWVHNFKCYKLKNYRLK